MVSEATSIVESQYPDPVLGNKLGTIEKRRNRSETGQRQQKRNAAVPGARSDSNLLPQRTTRLGKVLGCI